MTFLDLVRRVLAPKGEPVFFRVRSLSGRQIGMSLHCPDCHFVQRHSLQPGQRIRCSCRTWTAPRFPSLLPVERLGGSKSTVLFDPWWDEPVTRPGDSEAGDGFQTIQYR